MLDLEDELRSLLHERSSAVQPSRELDARIVRRVRGTIRTRRLVSAFVAVAAIAGGTIATTSLVTRDEGSTVSVVPGPAASGPDARRALDIEPGQWATIAEPPMTGAFASVSLGSEIVVAFRVDSRVRFAGYDPGRDAWSAIPDPPVDIQEPFTDSSTFVWTGSKVLVWGYENHERETFSGNHRLLAYDPEAHEWTRLADPPIVQLIQAHPIWTGEELIVWGGNFNGDDAPAQGAAYNPSTDGWRRIANAPMSTRENPMIVWTGHEMIVWGGLTNGDATTANRVEGAAYDPATDSWRTLPSSGSERTSLSAAVWTRREMVVFTALASQGLPSGPVAVGLAYDPATNRWRDIASSPLAPREHTSWTWTGSELVVWGGISFENGRQTHADGAAYDPGADRWRLLSPAPLAARWGATMTWADGLLIVVGGNGPSAPGRPSEPPATRAAAYRP